MFTQSQFLLLNVAVGGIWPGSPDATTTFPQRMTVDYVRVYVPVTLADNGVNVLVNPGFEAGGLTDWTPYGNAIGNAQLAHIRNLPVHTGSNAFKVFGQFNGTENYSGLIQDVPAAPGTTYSAGAWAFTPSNDRIAGANAAWVEVSFRDALSNIKSLYRTPVINSASPAGTWLQLAVTNQINPAYGAIIRTVHQLLAPAGTTKVRCQVVFRQPASADGAVLFDDFKLVRNEAEGFPVTLAATRSGGDLQLAFDTYLDRHYEVRSTFSLASAPWLVLTNVLGDGATRIVRVEMPFPASFYRVNRLEN